MKKNLTIFFLILFSIASFAKERTIEYPAFTARNTGVLDFKRILISDTATILEVEAKYTPKYWIKTPSSTYLKAGDQLLKKTEENKKKMGYIVAEVPHVAPDQILDTLIDTYKGNPLPGKR